MLKAPDWSPAWWDREEALRRALLAKAEARYPERALWTALTELTTETGDLVHGKAATAAARMGSAARRRSMSRRALPRRPCISWRWRDWPKTPPRPSKASFVCSPRDAGRWASWALRWSSSERTSRSMTSYAAPARTIGRLKRPFGNLYYEVSGSGPALLFAHGLGGNHLSWWQQVAHFAPHYTCVTFAHRGFAPSDPVAGGPDAARLRRRSRRADRSSEILRTCASSPSRWAAGRCWNTPSPIRPRSRRWC